MSPTFCPFHQHWTDGPCAPGKRSLNRLDLAIRISDIEFLLDDDEECQSRGYYGKQALGAERVQLQFLHDGVFGGSK